MIYSKRTTNKQIVISRLLRSIWALTPPNDNKADSLTNYEVQAYFDHYEELLHNASLIQQEEVTLGNTAGQSQKVVALVETVRRNWRKSITEIKAAIVSPNAPEWLIDPSDQTALSKSVDFAVRLWLFVPLQMETIALKQSAELAQALEALDRKTITEEVARLVPLSKSVEGTLSYDFSLKSLIRKGGLRFQPTSDLCQHLMMEDLPKSTVVYVFRHAKVLEKYQDEDYGEIYPSGFLDEVYRTLHLLFPIADQKRKRRTKKYAQRFHFDIETDIEAQSGLTKLDQIKLASYPYFGQRLKAIQERYDKAKPRKPRQWWYDRRKRVEWATLLVAVIVFFLTVIFGIISSVTGILQVIATFRWH